ncbi:hypothetical protein C7M84_006608 [Penaeus vannamei]|uniref:Uncharacterized protein n=1 Tax=Penaeus vannamei TaxID=6689 RepID=A0A3R7MFB7_PENVA|nr:hypothetical protein C7M84_006608 [Penaeus vannamei]
MGPGRNCGLIYRTPCFAGSLRDNLCSLQVDLQRARSSSAYLLQLRPHLLRECLSKGRRTARVCSGALLAAGPRPVLDAEANFALLDLLEAVSAWTTTTCSPSPSTCPHRRPRTRSTGVRSPPYSRESPLGPATSRSGGRLAGGGRGASGKEEAYCHEELEGLDGKKLRLEKEEAEERKTLLELEEEELQLAMAMSLSHQMSEEKAADYYDTD